MFGGLIMTAFEIGKEISFTYLKGAESAINAKGVLTKDYSALAENYSGTVVDVRDIEEHPVSDATLRYGKIKGERSNKLVTVENADGEAKAFYNGRMVNAMQAIK
tara:strand:+ start:90 stop:404 length:315 start_codon:yes stop_codon:yes gene_type:complete